MRRPCWQTKCAELSKKLRGPHQCNAPTGSGCTADTRYLLSFVLVTECSERP